MAAIDPLSDGEIQSLFVDVDAPEPNSFEFALVLGGTVSAGAYTAGAVDFLIEALDEWTSRRDQGSPEAPRHKVILKLIAGTSGGGVNAAITARALAYEFPHVDRGTASPQTGTGNPFYDTWVNGLTLTGFLGTTDVDAGQVASLLDGAPIDKGAADIADYESGPPLARSYVADPLRVMLTVTNLCGVPYKTSFGDVQLTETFIDHADHVRFALVYPGRELSDPRPDEFVLSFGDERFKNMTDWTSFSLFARATSAFPIGFPPRALVRPVEHYRYRVVVLPPDKDGQQVRVVGRVPDWDAMIPSGVDELPADYHFLAVDGGATDNEPIALARAALAGALGRNPRSGEKANRAVLLIDPFAGKAGLGPSGPTAIPKVIGSLLSSFTEQTRYDSADLLLAADPDVFSRFMITPKRDGRIGGDAIAANGLSAFIGFASPSFMRHDYILGRRNCQKFLRSSFVLEEGNSVFDGMWTDEQKEAHAVTEDGTVYLPIIPLLGKAAVEETAEPWPRHALNPETYRAAIESRFKAVVEFEGQGGVLTSVASFVLAHLGEEAIADVVINAMNKSLADSGLA